MGIVTNSTDKYQKCIDACNRCAQACMECMQMCMNEPDVTARKKCIAKLDECISICHESSKFMIMDAQHAQDICNLCETICNECAQECGMFKDDHCKKCEGGESILEALLSLPYILLTKFLPLQSED